MDFPEFSCNLVFDRLFDAWMVIGKATHADGTTRSYTYTDTDPRIALVGCFEWYVLMVEEELAAAGLSPTALIGRGREISLEDFRNLFK